MLIINLINLVKNVLLLNFNEAAVKVGTRCTVNAGLVDGMFVVVAGVYHNNDLLVEYANAHEDLELALYGIMRQDVRKKY